MLSRNWLLIGLLILCAVIFMSLGYVPQVSNARTGNRVTLKVSGNPDGKELVYDSNKSALVLVDMWEGISHLQKNIEEINLMVTLLRNSGAIIIRSPNGQPVNKTVNFQNDIVLPQGTVGLDILLRILDSRQVNYVFYAGYYSTNCLVSRDTGIASLAYAEDGKYRKRIIFVKDASAAVDGIPSVSPDKAHDVATYIIEANWAMTTTIQNMKDGIIVRQN